MPVLNKGTGANPAVYGVLCNWAQRGVERAALVFFILGGLIVFALPSGQIPTATGIGFVLAVCAQLLQNAARARLQMEFKMAHAFAIDLSTCLLHLCVSLGLWLQGWDPLSSYWFGAFAAATYSVFRMRAQASKLEENDSDELKQHLTKAGKEGREMLKGSVANSACSRVQPYLLGAFASAETLAFYGVIWTLIGPIRLLTMALSNLLRPRLALYINRARMREYWRLFRLAISLIALTTVISVGLSYALGAHITELLFGPELATAGTWLFLGVLYAGLDAVTSCQMIAAQTRLTNGAEITARLRIRSAMISVPLFIIGTLQFGLTGSIGSLIIAELYYLTACWLISSDRRQPVNSTAQALQL